MVQIKHRIKEKYINTDIPLLFFRNALSSISQYSEKSVPVQLSYPDLTMAFGFDPVFNSKLFQQIDFESESQNILEKPSIIVSSECNDFEFIRIDLYFWGSLYISCLVLLLIYITLLLLNQYLSNIFVFGELKQDKCCFYIFCLLLTASPLIAVVNRLPLFMMLYKAVHPSATLLLCALFLNYVQDAIFLLFFLFARLSISYLQHNLVSFSSIIWILSWIINDAHINPCPLNLTWRIQCTIFRLKLSILHFYSINHLSLFLQVPHIFLLGAQ
ncbi:hypothetical protein RS030_152320 [Cryptosporidium xiaoi]|uniref:Uncharacterized protein n=1 Tax=Cryptosporidium xiaoi TaxID=659607 RepID=A0AAV9Y796_9CRYT